MSAPNIRCHTPRSRKGHQEQAAGFNVLVEDAILYAHPDTISPVQAPPRIAEPERNLWLTVLMEALDDLKSHRVSRVFKTSLMHQDRVADAIAFFRHDAEDLGSFPWIARLLRGNVDAMRERLAPMIAEAHGALRKARKRKPVTLSQLGTQGPWQKHSGVKFAERTVRFIETWNTSDTLDDFVAETGIDRNGASARATVLRKSGVNLKKFSPPGRPPRAIPEHA